MEKILRKTFQQSKYLTQGKMLDEMNLKNVVSDKVPLTLRGRNSYLPKKRNNETDFCQPVGTTINFCHFETI